ncbi:EamA family transporter [uncultured Acetobacteroides sp.]|uniref:DMT family transporter n=1 Tax=uncultured Acetobacteroides sp. TaxID=1760811 RepID=UPI0029F4E3E0|nr:EamA family transporter [uncultured Acetobacteroides sp.]
MSNSKGATLLFIGCLLMGSMGTFANFVQGTHPLNILLMRYGFALAGLLAILLLQLIIKKNEAKQYVSRNWSAIKASPKVYLLTGLVSALVMATYVMGTLRFSVGLSVVMLYTATIYLPFIEKMIRRYFMPSLHRSKFGRRYYISSSINLLGLLLVVASTLSDAKLNLIGLISAVASGFLFSILMVQVRAMKGSGIDAEHTLVSGALVGFTLLFPAAFLLPISFTPHNLAAATGLGVLATAIGGIFYFKGFSAVRPDLAPLLAYFEPIFGSMLALIFLGERYSLLAVVGVILIIGTSIAYTYLTRRGNSRQGTR